MDARAKAVERQIRLWVIRQERERLDRRASADVVAGPASSREAPPKGKGSRTGSP